MSEGFLSDAGLVGKVVTVPFHESFLHTTLDGSGQPVVVLRPTIEAMGLDWTAQLKKLKARSWATVAETATVGADGKTRDMATVDLDTWAMLLANINENAVNDEARDLVIRYQKESARVLREYWSGSMVQHQFAIPQSFAEAMELAAKQARELEQIRPDAVAFRVLASDEGDVSVRDAATILRRDKALQHIGERNLFKAIRDFNMVGDDDRPYQNHKTHLTQRPFSERGRTLQLRVTVLGLKYLHKRLHGVDTSILDEALLEPFLRR